VTISNQFLAIPPDHPLAAKMYDLIGLQFATIPERNAAHWAGDVPRTQRADTALAMIGAEMGTICDQIRAERGADATCTVGLTYDAAGHPVVDGRYRRTLN
jgi:hypothetical protein